MWKLLVTCSDWLICVLRIPVMRNKEMGRTLLEALERGRIDR